MDDSAPPETSKEHGEENWEIEEKEQTGLRSSPWTDHVCWASDTAAQTTEYELIPQPRRVPNGLYNQGATCYLNSVLQVLSMTTEIYDRLDPNVQTDLELKTLFEELKKNTCETKKITATFRIVNVDRQCDAAECLEWVLHHINPQASQVFQGELLYKTICQTKSHSINEETNPFWILPLSLTDGHDSIYSVERGLESIFEPKSFSGDNLVFCPECKMKTEGSSGCQMVEFPQILAVLLKRFDFDYYTMSHSKSNRCVDVPCALQIKNKTYKLYAMVNHMGTLNCGHYTATILSQEDNTWYEFNDRWVTQAGQPFANKTCKSSTAYLLMYRASDKEEAKKAQDETNKEPGGDEGEQKPNVCIKMRNICNHRGDHPTLRWMVILLVLVLYSLFLPLIVIRYEKSLYHH